MKVDKLTFENKPVTIIELSGQVITIGFTRIAKVQEVLADVLFRYTRDSIRYRRNRCKETKHRKGVNRSNGHAT